jgi:hypothetical protein
MSSRCAVMALTPAFLFEEGTYNIQAAEAAMLFP